MQLERRKQRRQWHVLCSPPPTDPVELRCTPADNASLPPIAATQVTDSELSTDFFNNRTRMWYDLLGDVAEAHVGRIYSGF